MSSAGDEPKVEAASSKPDEDEEGKRGSMHGSSAESSAAAEGLAAALGELRLRSNTEGSKAATKEPLLSSFDIRGIAGLIRGGKAKKIVVMTGAGISVSAGIPDFRTPGTGLYSQLEKYELPYPEAVFTIDFFKRNPQPFIQLAKELYPGLYKPTLAHYFITLLHKKGLLLRCFTQNIDSLEHLAGLPKDMIVAAHGNFDSASCIRCKRSADVEGVKAAIFSGEVAQCKCGSLVKPDIVFFGESLPDRFERQRKRDMPECDLLIVMGTSLQVHPFAGLLNCVGPAVPRLLINREVVGVARKSEVEWYREGRAKGSPGFMFHLEDNDRDALYLGDCDEGALDLCEALGWGEELQELVALGHKQVEEIIKRERAALQTGRQQAG